MNPSIRLLTFHTTPPITSPITKFGGQPVWIAQPQWPLSRSTGNQMRFIAQVYLPDDMRRGGQQMAYIFMTDEEDYVDGTWEPEGGENAVILQPCAFDPVVKTIDQATGPTLQQPVEVPGAARRTFRDVELTVQFEDVPADSKEALHNLSRFGGAALDARRRNSGWRSMAVPDANRFDGCRLRDQSRGWRCGVRVPLRRRLARRDSCGKVCEGSHDRQRQAKVIWRADDRFARIVPSKTSLPAGSEPVPCINTRVEDLCSCGREFRIPVRGEKMLAG